MASAKAIENNLVSVANFLGSSATLALRIGGDALPIVQFAAGFVPGLAPAVQVMGVALPIIAKIAAGAPVVAQAIDENRPVIDALVNGAPDIVGHLKQLYSIAIGQEPDHPDAHLSPDEISIEAIDGFALAGLVSVEHIARQSFFAPQDPRFSRDDPSSH